MLVQLIESELVAVVPSVAVAAESIAFAKERVFGITMLKLKGLG